MFKVGLIGCGFMGGTHADCYNEIEGVQLVAVADVRPEKAEEVAKKCGVSEIYSTGVELIQKADVDIIDICLPTFLHTEHAELAMKKGVHVFIEKPVCLTKEEGERLLKLEKETGAKVQVGQAVRFCDEWVWLKNAIDTKKYGNLKFAYRNREFWCKGYYVDTAGKNTKAIKQYIADQLKRDAESDQLSMFDPRNPFTGSK